LAAGLKKVGQEFRNLATVDIPRFASAVSDNITPAMPAMNMMAAGGGSTINAPINVSGTVRNDEDLHKLAYLIAREFTQQVRR
jgi:hypothetical protein